MKKTIIAANWKMHGSLNLVQDLTRALQTIQHEFPEVIVFPSFIYIDQLLNALAQTTVRVGAQNVAQFEQGAYTGEVAASQLKDLGCRYVLIGHSERRQLFGETNAVVAEKFSHVKAANLIPVLCVGETLAQREAHQAESIILAQLRAVVDHMGADTLNQSIIAYEPIWAIGTGVTASPEQAQSMHGFLRRALTDLGVKQADSLPLLYGGSVKADNIRQLLTMPDVDGALVGGASLKANEFLEIVAIAHQMGLS